MTTNEQTCEMWVDRWGKTWLDDCMTTNRNANRTWVLHFENGETVTETARNTMGGWTNMARRLEARFGGRLRMADGSHGTVAGRSFVVVEG